MSIPVAIAVFLLGLLILYFGAEWLLAGSVRLARRAGISAFVIGLTLVAFGTSAPELAVNISAALSGSRQLALGNVVGSNIANVGLILGICALASPLLVHMRMLKREVPILVLVSLLLWWFASDSILSRTDSLIFLIGFLLFTLFVCLTAQREPTDVKEEVAEVADAVSDHTTVISNLFFVLVGLVGLIGGAELMVRAAVAMAREFGVSEMMIGLTVVAIGTSLPELASSVVAVRRSQSDIAVGNVIGSNIFNILLILGITGSIIPLEVPESVRVLDIPVMLGFTIVLVPIMIRGLRITRIEGGLLVVLYLAFLGYQIVREIGINPS